MLPPCPFCQLPADDLVWSDGLVVALLDRYPVSPGHTLVLPRRHVATWFDASPEEQLAIWHAVDKVKRQLDEAHRPDGYNVGFNAGAAAGQTVMHLHVHVIPRFTGDMDDPRGGVRHVIPSRGNYLRQQRALASGGESDPFSQHVLPLVARSHRVDVVAAFVQESGLVRIQPSLESALRAGGTVRLLTGDYLDITQVSALERLLDWQSTWSMSDDGDEETPAGSLQVRVIEVEQLPGQTRSFHPKSWHLEGRDFGCAFVGSSNLSRSALDTGIEWNLRVDRDRDADAWRQIWTAFQGLWDTARPLEATWIQAYALRVRARPTPLPAAEIEAPPSEPVTPHEVQAEALASLRTARAQGHRRTVVVLATGLGKTWLAAFDLAQLWDELGRCPRLLFLAHRREILRQAASTYRRLLRERGAVATLGWFLEEHADLSADWVFASVSKLSRPTWLERLAQERFDYVVLDEVHHAAADSYRRILAQLDPTFLVGLTATPDRADAADILGLFDDHVAYRADLARGIAIGRLVPFRYFGLKDEVDYTAIPWRNKRFDPEQLAAAVQTERRMSTLWEAWSAHPGTRTLVFCCTVAHADYVAGWLGERGVRVAKVYAAPGGDDRQEALERLVRGELDAICAIDVFNEGVDVPSLDRVVMLRPTESGVVFLQQLGRGLRAAEGKPQVTVVDFVGNHRIFLEQLRTVLSLGAESPGLLAKLVSDGRVELPAGCSVEVQLEAKRFLEVLFSSGGTDSVERAYRELKASRGRRPTAGELQRMGYLPNTLRKRHQSWFAFVRSEGDLDESELQALGVAGAFLDELEVTAMTKSFKIVTLDVLLDVDALTTGLPVRDLALRCWARLRRSPELLADVPENERLPDPPDEPTIRRWVAYWRSNPIAAWTGRKTGRAWFVEEGDRFRLRSEAHPALPRLVRELVDYRLARYRRPEPAQGAFVCRVTWNQREPILKLPDRSKLPVPEGDVSVRLHDGGVWTFRFVRLFCNVAFPVGTDKNQLGELMRRWFGPQAGHPSTAFDVRFTSSPDGWWVEPVQEQGAVRTRLRSVPVSPDLRSVLASLETERVLLPIDSEDSELFAVRAVGGAMEGVGTDLRDGDWAIFRSAPRQTLPLFAADRPASDEARATLVRVIRPEELAPAVGAVLSAAELADDFGFEQLAPRSGRQGGHLFVFLEEKGQLEAFERLRAPPPHPGEAAYVLAPTDSAFRYLGVGRWREGAWSIPEVDFSTWRAWGEGREASRPLPPGALDRAQRVVEAILARPEAERVLQRPGGRRARVLGAAPRGGLRIDGGEGGAKARTVSLTDLAWVALAGDDVAHHGGLLDEARVNRLRYLEGTPKESTRWIDTGWALAAWALEKG
jgi:superfamily II DNA or RNA helicase/diadenosine tetraphosphate (Ap4A) HIT family hydrolase